MPNPIESSLESGIGGTRYLRFLFFLMENSKNMIY